MKRLSVARRKPCPFCAWVYSDIEQRLHGRGRNPRYFVRCCACGAKGPECDDQVEASREWDRRRSGDVAAVVMPFRA